MGEKMKIKGGGGKGGRNYRRSLQQTGSCRLPQKGGAGAHEGGSQTRQGNYKRSNFPGGVGGVWGEGGEVGRCSEGKFGEQPQRGLHLRRPNKQILQLQGKAISGTLNPKKTIFKICHETESEEGESPSHQKKRYRKVSVPQNFPTLNISSRQSRHGLKT